MGEKESMSDEREEEEERKRKWRVMENLEEGLHSDLTFTGSNMGKHVKEKIAIGCYIADRMIKRNASVFLDAGSTTRMIARAILARNMVEKLGLTIVTNNMDIMEDYRHLVDWLKPPPDDPVLQLPRLPQLHLTGGLLDEEHHAFFGPIAADAIREIGTDVVIMGTSGFRFDRGLHFRSAIADKEVKEESYSKPTKHRVIALDHSKLGETDMFLCESKLADRGVPKEERGIGSIAKGVTDRVTIITSAPNDKQEDERIAKKVDEFTKKGSIIDKLRRRDPKIYLAQVKYTKEYPYYKIVRDIDPDKAAV